MLKKNLILLAVIPILLIGTHQVFGDDIDTAYTEVTTAYTGATGSFADITNAIIADTEFTNGDDYLIVITAVAKGATNNAAHTSIKLIGTASSTFENSEFRAEYGGSDRKYWSYTYFTVWTAVASEGVKLQALSTNSDSEIDQITMFALNLDDYGTEDTDWRYDIDLTNTALTSSPTWTSTNNALETWTPANSGDDWLVMATTRVSTAAFGKQLETHIQLDSSEDFPIYSMEGEDIADRMIHTVARVFNLDDSSHTVEAESRRESGGGGTYTREDSAIFVMNLDRFEVNAHFFEEDEETLSTTSFATEWATIDITPTETKDVWCYASGLQDRGSGDGGHSLRLQVEDNVSVQNDEPPTQTADDYATTEARDGTDEIMWAIQTRENLNTNTHTVDGDGYIQDVGNEDWSNKMLFCVQLTISSGVTVTNKQLTEGIQYDDLRSTVFLLIRNEGIQFDDQQVGSKSILQILAEGIEFDDIRVQNLALMGLITEGVQFNDQRSSRQVMTRQRTEGIQFDDQQVSIKTGATTVQLSEGIQFDDVRGSIQIILTPLSEGIQFDDQRGTSSILVNQLSEGIQFDDQRGTNSIVINQLSEGIQFDDQRGTTSIIINQLSEGIEFDDVRTGALSGAVTKQLTEGIQFDDQRGGNQIIFTPLIEGIEFDDQRTGSIGANVFLQALSEGIEFDDQQAGIRVGSTIQQLTEGIEFDDVRTGALSGVITKQLSEGIQFADVRSTNGITILPLSEGIQFLDSSGQVSPPVVAPTGNAILLYCNTPQLNTVGCVFSFDCGAGNYIRGINLDGTVLCEALP